MKHRTQEIEAAFTEAQNLVTAVANATATVTDHQKRLDARLASASAPGAILEADEMSAEIVRLQTALTIHERALRSANRRLRELLPIIDGECQHVASELEAKLNRIMEQAVARATKGLKSAGLFAEADLPRVLSMTLPVRAAAGFIVSNPASVSLPHVFMGSNEPVLSPDVSAGEVLSVYRRLLASNEAADAALAGKSIRDGGVS